MPLFGSPPLPVRPVRCDSCRHEVPTEVRTVSVLDANWYPDPYHRHEYRYWDGHAWTPNVSDDGQVRIDKVGQAIVDSNIEILLAPNGDYTPGVNFFKGTRKRWGDPGDDTTMAGRMGNRTRVHCEDVIVNGETPTILGLSTALATDKALYFFISTIRHPFRVDTERYEFAKISNLDKKGFDYEGVRVKKKWKRKGRIDERFYWLLFKDQPQLAARFLVQQSEVGVPLTHRLVKLGCLVSAEATPTAAAPGQIAEQVQTAIAPAAVEVVVARDPDRYNADDFYQFVTCPVCGDQLRLHIVKPLKKSSHIDVEDSDTVGILNSRVARVVAKHSILDQALF
jgi:Protein of unknown function (DUF2510)